MHNPLVSIIVPVHNAASYLSQCLDSLLAQSYQNIEVIAINDGSQDDSWGVMQAYKKDKRFHCLTQMNQGVSATRNRAIGLAKGEYMMFVDADDWLEPDTIEECVKAVSGSGADVCMFDYMREFRGRSERRALFGQSQTFSEEACRSLQCRMLGPIGKELAVPQTLDSFATIWGKLYRRAVVADIQFVDLKIIGTAEDTLFNCFAFLRVRKIVYLHVPYYHYRKYNASAETKRYKSDLWLRWNNLFEYMRQSVTTEKAEKALSNRIALSIIGLGLNECMSGKSFFQKRKQLAVILEQPHYRVAYKNLELKYFPIHWKVFFLCAKYRFYGLLLVLLTCIKRLIG